MNSSGRWNARFRRIELPCACQITLNTEGSQDWIFKLLTRYVLFWYSPCLSILFEYCFSYLQCVIIKYIYKYIIEIILVFFEPLGQKMMVSSGSVCRVIMRIRQQMRLLLYIIFPFIISPLCQIVIFRGDSFFSTSLLWVHFGSWEGSLCC